MKTSLASKVIKLNSAMILVFYILIRFLDLDNFLDLNLIKFGLLDLVKISIILFLLNILINTSKYSINFIEIVLSIKINNIAILLKL